MKLGEFIKQFSHNNVIRLWHKVKGGHQIVLETFNDVSMDLEVNKQKGKYRHYINNEVLGLTTCLFNVGSGVHHSDALNIVIEKLENQPFLEEIIEDKQYQLESN